MKIFRGWKYAYIYRLDQYLNTLNNAMFKWFWTMFSLGAPYSICAKGVKTVFYQAAKDWITS